MLTRSRLLAILVALTLVAAACGSDDGGSAGGNLEKDGDCASEDYYCVGLVTDVGKVDDKSFNQSAWEGLQDSEADYVEFIETQDSKDYANNIQGFLDQGFDAIVTVGFSLGEATGIAAAENPDVDFIGVDQFQGEAIANVAGLIFPENKAGFMAGALAGLMTESNVIGAVLGTDLVPPVVAFKEGYEKGALYTNADATFVSTYHPGGLDVAFGDPDWGATTARQAIGNGADVIFGAGGATGNGALAEVAKDEGVVFCIGVDTDQWETVPEAHPCLITSAMKLIDAGVVDLVAEAKAGSMTSGNFVGDVGLADYHDFEDVIPDDVKDEMEKIIAGVLDDSIDASI